MQDICSSLTAWWKWAQIHFLPAITELNIPALLLKAQCFRSRLAWKLQKSFHNQCKLLFWLHWSVVFSLNEVFQLYLYSTKCKNMFQRAFKGTLWSFWSLLVLWSNVCVSLCEFPFCLRFIRSTGGLNVAMHEERQGRKRLLPYKHGSKQCRFQNHRKKWMNECKLFFFYKKTPQDTVL